jgi:formylglycine-generating enzyme required for sulfatase activity
MGRSNSGTDAYPDGDSTEQDTTDGDPEHEVTVSTFTLDKYEVTVGRFREFVECMGNGTCSSWEPAPGAGANEAVETAHPSYDTGWQESWDVPANVTEWDDVLTCNSSHETWTPSGTGDETLAINCVNWYEAMAFCIWDGGRLPTEAEWEHAAAGGDENNLYPWGSTPPADDCVLANWGGCEPNEVRSVGGSTAGAARWGHEDLAGNVWEWVFDWYDDGWYDNASASGQDACSVTESTDRVSRGGYFRNSSTAYLRVAYRLNYYPANHNVSIGFRCSRIP